MEAKSWVRSLASMHGRPFIKRGWWAPAGRKSCYRHLLHSTGWIGITGNFYSHLNSLRRGQNFHGLRQHGPGPWTYRTQVRHLFRKDVSTSPRRWLFGRGPQGIAAGDPPWYAGADRDRCRPPHSSSPASANPNKPRCRQPCVWGFERVLFFREMLLCWNVSNQLKLNNLPWVNLQWRENLNVRRERGLPPPLF